LDGCFTTRTRSTKTNSLRFAPPSDGRVASGIDFSLVTAGLRAERVQGITIDVSYRYFSTPRRKFIAADSPGHET
jgi:sulfate adenylyltransferase subunit 1 (EFTu-like GTPase family)